MKKETGKDWDFFLPHWSRTEVPDIKKKKKRKKEWVTEKREKRKKKKEKKRRKGTGGGRWEMDIGQVVVVRLHRVFARLLGPTAGSDGRGSRKFEYERAIQTLSFDDATPSEQW